MFFRSSIVSVLACLTLLLGACEEQSQPAAAPAVDHHAVPAATDHHAVLDAVKTTTAQATDAVKTTTAQATEAANTWVAQAKPLVAQATQYVKDHKYELAQQTLTKLDALKPHLSTSMQDQIANLHKLVDAAKLSGMKLPGM